MMSFPTSSSAPNPRTIPGLVPLTHLNQNALDKLETMMKPTWFNFYKDVHTPSKCGHCNSTFGCTPPRIPHFPLDGQELIENMILNKHKCGVHWKNPKISCIPNILVLNDMTRNGTCVVNNFIVEHENYGSITYRGNVDVFGKDLDSMWCSASADPDDDIQMLGGDGDCLSEIPSRMVAKNIWPKDDQGERITNPSDPRLLDYWKEVKETCDAKGWTYVGYDHTTGIAQADTFF